MLHAAAGRHALAFRAGVRAETPSRPQGQQAGKKELVQPPLGSYREARDAWCHGRELRASGHLLGSQMTKEDIQHLVPATSSTFE